MKQRLDFITKMKKVLISKRNELGTLLFRTSREGVIEKGQVKDSADEALTSTMGKLQSSIEATEIDELKLIEEALVRIDKDEYGICIECAKAVSTKRLETYPYAARCISCQERLES